MKRELLRMIRQLLLVIASMQLATSASLEQPAQQIKYDDRLQLTLSVTAESQTRQVIEGRARRFIWNHFRQHHTGYLILKTFTKEGEPVVSRYYIRPGDSGKWTIEVLITRILSDRYRGEQIHSKDHYVAYDLKLTEPSSKSVISDAPPELDLGFMKSHMLQLIDKDSKVITEL
jgi:hypothetical protein